MAQKRTEQQDNLQLPTLGTGWWEQHHRCSVCSSSWKRCSLCSLLQCWWFHQILILWPHPLFAQIHMIRKNGFGRVFHQQLLQQQWRRCCCRCKRCGSSRCPRCCCRWLLCHCRQLSAADHSCLKCSQVDWCYWVRLSAGWCCKCQLQQSSNYCFRQADSWYQVLLKALHLSKGNRHLSFHQSPQTWRLSMRLWIKEVLTHFSKLWTKIKVECLTSACSKH